MAAQHYKTQASTIARVVHTLLASESFDTLADLTDALKFKLAKAHIRWTNEDLNDAYRLVASARRLPGLQLPRRLVERPLDVDPHPISRDDAAALLAQLSKTSGVKATVKTPPATTRPDLTRDQLHAQARAIAPRYPRRKPFTERLAEIFEDKA